MNKITLDLPTTVEFDDELIDDIVSGALEGGINYWCKMVDVDFNGIYRYASDVITLGGILRVELTDEDREHCLAEVEGCDFILNKGAVVHGIKTYLEKTDGLYITGGKINDSALDADSYDAIIQYALFDKLIFG